MTGQAVNNRSPKQRCHVNPDEFPAPEEGFVITHLLVVADQDRSREFYRSPFEGQVVLERDPVVMDFWTEPRET